jgi:hypothetical protein
MARWYIWNQELEAATTDLNAGLSALRAKEKRNFAAQLRADADAKPGLVFLLW